LVTSTCMLYNVLIGINVVVVSQREVCIKCKGVLDAPSDTTSAAIAAPTCSSCYLGNHWSNVPFVHTSSSRFHLDLFLA